MPLPTVRCSQPYQRASAALDKFLAVDAPLRAKALEQLLADRLSDALARDGLLSVRCGWPTWRRPSTEDKWLFVSLQADAKATDHWAGGQFRLEWQKSSSEKPSGGLTGRALFFQLLLPDELTKVLAQQNLVRLSLPIPTSDHAAAYPAGAVRDMYLSYFEPQTRFDPVSCWLACRSADHVGLWASTLAPLLPVMAERAERLLNDETVHLGQGSLLTA